MPSRRPGQKPPAASGSLAEYHRKRRFERTPEPPGEVAPAPGPALSFVVQKHAARRLHYDFRLELGGVLKSWAVPKGPSLDPAERRLAVATEDHPLDYGGFEGVIPAGQYGGGTVLLWDRGRWIPDAGDAAAAEEAYRKGKLEFRLEGEKLAGGWRLVQTHGPRSEGGKSWLLIKRNDDEARPGEGQALVEGRPESVASGRSMEAIAADPARVWHSGEDGGAEDDSEDLPDDLRRRRGAAAGVEIDLAALPGARRAKLPRRPPAPQLATLARDAPSGDGWLHEIKHDGYRALARLERRRGGLDVRLVTRNGNDWTDRFPAVARALSGLPVEAALVDGEVVALAADGTSSFAALQQALGTRGGRGGGQGAPLVYYAFDLLHLDGVDLSSAALAERKALLAGLLARAGSDETATLRTSDHVVGRGGDFFRQACRFALEGVISKRADAPYRPGRGRDWLKVKCSTRQELVIGGFTEPSGSRSGLGSLILGVYPAEGEGEDDGRKLLYAGRVGTGFDAETLIALRRRLEAIESEESPFADPKAAATGGSRRTVHWVRPELVCEVEFTEWTTDGVLRHPSFQGLREDKAASEVVRETAQPVEEATMAGTARAATTKPARAAKAATTKAATKAKPEKANPQKAKPAKAKPERAKAKKAKTEKAKPEKAKPEKAASRGGGRGGGEAVEIGGTRVSNPDRVLYPEQGLTKRQLAEYYVAVAGAMLPHLAGRPLTLVRCPQGQGEGCFYQKHVEKGFPSSVGRVEVAEKDGDLATYAVVESLPALVAMVQMGVLEIHVWGARRDRIERPDLLVWDLDPDEGLPWERVVEGALAVRTILDELGLVSFAKTTGGKGLHVVVPIERRLGWDEARDFTRAVSERIVEAAPDRFLATMSKAKRQGKVFIDYLRNGRGATFIAPYSARARPGATVAMPVSWDEVPEVEPGRFDVTSVPGWLAERGEDPWAAMADVRQVVTKAMRRRVGAA
jgi:bifunctional non-homologous end joining protein LigD